MRDKLFLHSYHRVHCVHNRGSKLEQTSSITCNRSLQYGDHLHFFMNLLLLNFIRITQLWIHWMCSNVQLTRSDSSGTGSGVWETTLLQLWKFYKGSRTDREDVAKWHEVRESLPVSLLHYLVCLVDVYKMECCSGNNHFLEDESGQTTLIVPYIIKSRSSSISETKVYMGPSVE